MQFNKLNRTIIIMTKFNDQSERKLRGQTGFLASQTTVKRPGNKNKKQRSTNKQS